MKNKEVKNLMIYNYGHQCFLNGKITKTNPLTLHHIIPQRDKKNSKTTVENGALLCRMEHDLFNIVEVHNQAIADELNRLFQVYKTIKDEELKSDLREYMRYMLLTEFNQIDNRKGKVKTYKKG